MRFVDEFTTIENVQTENIQYHRSCYKSFASKHDFSASVFSTTAQNVSNPTEYTTSVKAVTRVSFLVRQGVWGPPRYPTSPGQSLGKGSRGQRFI